MVQVSIVVQVQVANGPGRNDVGDAVSIAIPAVVQLAEDAPATTGPPSVVRTAETSVARTLTAALPVKEVAADAPVQQVRSIPAALPILAVGQNVATAGAPVRTSLAPGVLVVELSRTSAIPVASLIGAVQPVPPAPYLADVVTRLFADGAGAVDAGLQNALEVLDQLELPALGGERPIWLYTLLATATGLAGLGSLYALHRSRAQSALAEHPWHFDWPKSEPSPWE